MRSYTIRARFFQDTWHIQDTNVYCNYETAGEIAMAVAAELDRQYNDEHFWTVDLINPDTDDSYYQFFHGRIR